MLDYKAEGPGFKPYSFFFFFSIFFQFLFFYHSPEPLYNTVRYNTVLDITWIRLGPQMAIQNFFSYITYAFYSRYNTVWIANTEIVWDPNISVIKRLWCMFQMLKILMNLLLHKNEISKCQVTCKLFKSLFGYPFAILSIKQFSIWDCLSPVEQFWNMQGSKTGYEKIFKK